MQPLTPGLYMCAGVSNGRQIKQQLMDVIIRVKMVRPFGVRSMVDMLEDEEMFSQSSRDAASAEVRPSLRLSVCDSFIVA